jgi:hypothetical protein
MRGETNLLFSFLMSFGASVLDEEAGGKSLLDRLREAPSGSAASSLTFLGITWHLP